MQDFCVVLIFKDHNICGEKRTLVSNAWECALVEKIKA